MFTIAETTASVSVSKLQGIHTTILFVRAVIAVWYLITSPSYVNALSIVAGKFITTTATVDWSMQSTVMTADTQHHPHVLVATIRERRRRYTSTDEYKVATEDKTKWRST